ncbi:MAG: DUF3810 domain-containing protein [Lachnospiraceae bacterium]|nr:DUF3810 domain-containing protein [Lachnospiraceae bacterium]
MKKRSMLIPAFMFSLALLLNVIAWHSKEFCDFYVQYIFPTWVNTYARLTGMFSFSWGEIMLVVAVLFLLAAAVGLIIAAVLLLKDRNLARRFWGRVRPYYRGLVWLSAFVLLVMTCNCFILYHCSTFEEKYDIPHEEYTVEELSRMRDYVVKKANDLAKEMERDEGGRVIYTGDMKAEAAKAMQKLAEQGYGQLEGYYPQPKGIMASGFLSQQHMLGYFFPFSMEANYNDVMYITNKPATMCHELSHLKGFIYEDEANYLAFLACIRSDDPLFRYSGYLSVLNYLDNAFFEAIGEDRDVYNSHRKISGIVKKDNVFLTPDAWKLVEKKAVISTKTVNKASKAFLEGNLQMNGVEDGIASYDRVVGLLLDYYKNEVIQ